MTTSYPYLKVARDNGVAYGVILRFADRCEASGFKAPGVHAPRWQHDTYDVIRDEQRRRREQLSPVSHTGHT